MITKKAIKNSKARVWTKSELRVTIDQAKAEGMEITQSDEMTEIQDRRTGDIVLRSLRTAPNMELVRFNSQYFES